MLMTHKQFSEVLEARIRKMRETLDRKAGEYAAVGDRLRHFKRSAAVMGKTRYEACAAFMTKHLTCVFDLVEAAGGDLRLDPAVIDEKVGDAINYLVLLEALFLERE
jgi:hypothetical protein